MPPCRTPGGNQERSRKKGSIIKLSDNYNFVELFPQLKILLAQQMTALQSTAPGTPFIYRACKIPKPKIKSPGVAYCRAEKYRASKAERRIHMKAILLELDKGENGRISEVGNVEKQEAFFALTAAAIAYYKVINDIDSTDEAIKAIGLDLLKTVAR